ncbi:beta-1,6-N-acetylglucosaminyltransferase [Flavivirga jejuensis]|uniref:Peptide O-xylosyltransferase n=1 Tax=Flavivirga jejuensis TaxID=870487 RepID=A0ABT8WRT2_9FLAO|nr:beta-1,6-N-acetylglucosaminyltransferase [Flavivirga jejuensis]MDO5975846.1 beta-1,6-N-acetylglucosaminyltransferase [Flavivirga jejuensis]
MKQAILITAYKNFDHLIDIVTFFDNDFELFIHIDKKIKVEKRIIDKIKNIDNVKFLSREYSINWGGLNHLKAYLLLAKAALKNQENKYFHLISGQDFPVKDLSYFKNILNAPKLYDHLEFFEIPSSIWKNQNGGLDRLEYYNFFDLIDAKKHIKWLWRLVRIQKKLHLKRRVSERIGKLYGGFTWWSLTRDTLQYVIDYTKEKPYLIHRMKHTFCSEEMYFQTIIMNSDFSKNVVNDNLRYIDWDPDRVGKDSPSPALLDMTDYEKINTSNKLFARKFDTPISDKLKSLIQKQDSTKNI